MTDTDPAYDQRYIARLPWVHRLIFRLFRKPIRAVCIYCAVQCFKKGKLRSAEMHEVTGVVDRIF